MTRKEAIFMLEQLRKSALPLQHITLDMAITALNPWRRLDKEKPPKMGRYRVCGINGRRYWEEVLPWYGHEYGFQFNGVAWDITHWAPLIPPEDEE